MIDFFVIDPRHLAIHARLLNWARYVDPKRMGWPMHVMWRQGRSNGRQWHEPVINVPVNTLDGNDLEIAVRKLPPPHMEAVRWWYVYRTTPNKARRNLGVTDEGLFRLVHEGRGMLVNRGV